jgi:predicted metal-dependent HD superfamily phosphohydrolase
VFTAEFLSHTTAKRVVAQEVLNRLKDRYKEPHRHYHTLAHIENGLKVHSELCSQPLQPLEFFAWVYHDAVYDTTQSDNEQKSAEVFMRDAKTLGFSMEDSDRVTKLILATAPSAEPLSVINDIDLIVLGAEPKVYDRYVKNIRKEYNWVEPEVWRKGRTAVLRQILKRPALYITEPFIEKFTLQAIENMSRELLSL